MNKIKKFLNTPVKNQDNLPLSIEGKQITYLGALIEALFIVAMTIGLFYGFIYMYSFCAVLDGI